MKRRIRITSIRDFGRNQDLYCKNCLLLRTARRVGDEEVVNNFVVGRLKEQNVGFEFV
jgi:hypothetical protein